MSFWHIYWFLFFFSWSIFSKLLQVMLSPAEIRFTVDCWKNHWLKQSIEKSHHTMHSINLPVLQTIKKPLYLMHSTALTRSQEKAILHFQLQIIQWIRLPSKVKFFPWPGTTHPVNFMKNHFSNLTEKPA